MVVFAVDLQVLGEHVDLLGEDAYLHLRRAGVALVLLEASMISVLRSLLSIAWPPWGSMLQRDTAVRAEMQVDGPPAFAG